MAKEKPTMNVVFVGHVDAGKSTCVGRLMFDGGAVSEQEMVRLKTEAQKHGKAGFEFAYIMDSIKEERERGVTIDLSYKKLMTQKYEITIIDAPGHRDFVKNMITGASQADAAFLVIAAPAGVQPQTTEHLWLLRTMGVKNLAIAINKMDAVEYKEDRFKTVKEDVSKLLKQVGINPDNTPFLAVSGLQGDNIFKKTDKMPWYKGPSVVEQIDLFPAPELPTNLPMRMPVQDVYEITGIGTVPVGKVETGIMKIGQKVIVLPGRSGTGIPGEVKTIEAHHETLPDAPAGMNVGVNIRGVGKKDIARGDVICEASAPIPIVEEFIAQIAVINHPTVLAKGYAPVFHVHTAQVPCQFTELIEQIDPKTGQVIKQNPDFLKNGDVAKVRIRPQGNLCLETAKENPFMGRFAVRDAGATVAAGMCLEIVKKK
ncbi:MAG: Elongation factor 1-alpha [Candidatus Diapherotrites archaeon ADurb.Bin253]|jgi:elongation factor 1-alpha|nr:MAG: Elongation factor 1-alpha [Candidatus Diapherotrites archaeon ADurb.Bin253]HNZ52024.1 translation elongation factor EF-1 subunit alpha [Candidatus Pacearchaeota archaeon]HOC96781.1 translation elongation factor EF-1 subunit alpha [Candidatus Pacearchaeota archaeon]HOF44115.1 translation elongation factor EF-1 subunit alpha [Candidatus Pacearchaeota archaeon]HOH04106.1 translation elongation factor EF-1 subunit alpha [Candidatus Pacearchaeota archaeon]